MELRSSPEAGNDLERIVVRVRQDNPQAARRIAETIYQRCGDLRLFPNRGRSGRVADTRELVLAPLPFIVVYRFDPLRQGFTIITAVAHFTAGRYEEAIEWADRTLAAQPDYRPAMRFRAASCAYLGRIEEAHSWLRRMLRLEPELTIARVRASAPPFPPELLNRYVEGLRKAGLPEERGRINTQDPSRAPAQH